jgi:hypothetical protein
MRSFLATGTAQADLSIDGTLVRGLEAGDAPSKSSSAIVEEYFTVVALQYYYTQSPLQCRCCEGSVVRDAIEMGEPKIEARASLGLQHCIAGNHLTAKLPRQRAA